MKMDWFWIAFIAMLAFSVVFILTRKIADMGVKSEVLFIYYFGLSTIILGFYLFYNKIPLQISTSAFWIIFVMAILGVIGNVLMFNSIKIAVNPGYTLAIIGANTLVVALASIFIFKSEFTLIKGIGTIITIIGIILLGL